MKKKYISICKNAWDFLQVIASKNIYHQEGDSILQIWLIIRLIPKSYKTIKFWVNSTELASGCEIQKFLKSTPGDSDELLLYLE